MYEEDTEQREAVGTSRGREDVAPYMWSEKAS